MFFLAFLLFFYISNAQEFYQPEQVHLSIAESENSYVVTWVTQSSTGSVSSVLFGTNALNQIENGTQETFVDGGKEKRTIYIHRVVLRDLKPGTQYVYVVGSTLGWSERFPFKTLPAGSNWSPRIAVFGDMGNTNAKSIPFLQLEAENGNFDLMLHVGDFAYDMDTNNARMGDEFMRQVQPFTSIVPYMTCPGNHEQAYNFSNYRRRFSMPGGDGEGQFYSFNVGPVHVIGYSSEFYYFYRQYGWQQIQTQFDWLERDLQQANLPENRAKQPWIVAMAHRPMYCSNNDDSEHCVSVNNKARVGFPLKNSDYYVFGVEQLFYKHGVDLLFYAHEHSYERFWPVYDRRVCNGTQDPDNVYVDPPAPVHILTGSAGNREGEDPFYPGGQIWSAFRAMDYGYTRMQVHNSTHLSLEQVSVDQGGRVIDSMLYVRSQHGPQVFQC